MSSASRYAPKSFFIILIGLYFAQGLPSGILAKAIPPLMRDYGVSLSLIGALKLLALPWFLKFLWAPVVDSIGSRRQWILAIQSLMLPSLLALALFDLDSLMDSDQMLWFFLGLLLWINTLSATQDIATDGLAASQLHENQLGFANTIQVFAYKVGLIIGGSALLIFIDELGWRISIILLTGLLCLAILPAFNISKTRPSLSTAESNEKHSEKINYKKAFIDFFKQPGFALWLLILMSCKVADALGSSMLNPMLVDIGLSLADIGYLNSLISVIGLVGAVIGGALFLRWHGKALLLTVCLLQSTAILLFSLLTRASPESLCLIYAVAGFEQLVDGISTVVIFAFMMRLCRPKLEGTDYTIQNSIHIIGMGIASLASGFIAEHFGYPSLFIMAFALGMLSLVFIWRWQASAQQHTLVDQQEY